MSTKRRLTAVHSLTASQSPTGKPVSAGATFDTDPGTAAELIRLGKAVAARDAAK